MAAGSGRGGAFRDDLHRDLKNECWKESRGQADWVICVDVDELVWHPSLANYLAGCQSRGVTISVPTGFSILNR